jgi:hypothetical protein
MSYGGFPADLGALGGTTTPPTATGALLLDNTLAQLLKTSPATFNKYDFTYTQINSGAGFTVTAKPSTGNNAVRQFFLDEGGTIHYSDTATPDATSTILGN